MDPVGDGESAGGDLLAVSFGGVILPPGRSRYQRAQAREGMVNEEVGAIGKAQVGVALMVAAHATSWSWPGAATKAQCPQVHSHLDLASHHDPH